MNCPKRKEEELKICDVRENKRVKKEDDGFLSTDIALVTVAEKDSDNSDDEILLPEIALLVAEPVVNVVTEAVVTEGEEEIKSHDENDSSDEKAAEENVAVCVGKLSGVE